MDASRSLEGTRALITGAGRGIGRAIALALARAGANVAINYLHSGEGAEETAAACRGAGVRAISIRADVARGDEVRAMVADIEAGLGPIDLLVNNAAIITGKRLLDVTEAEWDEIVGINLKSVFLCAQAVAPGMLARQAGCIINLASAWGLHPRAGGMKPGVPYVASKGGVISLTRALAFELRPHVRVNAIAPGLIDSKPGMFDDVARSRAKRVTQLERVGEPAEIADVVLFLAGDGARYITGQVLGVDGGLD